MLYNININLSAHDVFSVITFIRYPHGQMIRKTNNVKALRWSKPNGLKRIAQFKKKKSANKSLKIPKGHLTCIIRHLDTSDEVMLLSKWDPYGLMSNFFCYDNNVFLYKAVNSTYFLLNITDCPKYKKANLMTTLGIWPMRKLKLTKKINLCPKSKWGALDFF